MHRTSLLFAVFALVALPLAGCEGETITVGQLGVNRPGGGAPRTGATSASDAAVEPELEPVPELPTYRDEDFAEAATNRDPFRNYARLFMPVTNQPVVQREVMMGNTAIDDMRLIAIISGVANPSAMILDEEGTGHSVHRGDYLGRADYVSTGGADSVPITLNWRVDRISPGEVILTRDDPSSPNRMALTRVLPLHDASETQAGQRSR